MKTFLTSLFLFCLFYYHAKSDEIQKDEIQKFEAILNEIPLSASKLSLDVNMCVEQEILQGQRRSNPTPTAKNVKSFDLLKQCVEHLCGTPSTRPENFPKTIFESYQITRSDEEEAMKFYKEIFLPQKTRLEDTLLYSCDSERSILEVEGCNKLKAKRGKENREKMSIELAALESNRELKDLFIKNYVFKRGLNSLSFYSFFNSIKENLSTILSNDHEMQEAMREKEGKMLFSMNGSVEENLIEQFRTHRNFTLDEILNFNKVLFSKIANHDGNDAYRPRQKNTEGKIEEERIKISSETLKTKKRFNVAHEMGHFMTSLANSAEVNKWPGREPFVARILNTGKCVDEIHENLGEESIDKKIPEGGLAAPDLKSFSNRAAEDVADLFAVYDAKLARKKESPFCDQTVNEIEFNQKLNKHPLAPARSLPSFENFKKAIQNDNNFTKNFYNRNKDAFESKYSSFENFQEIIKNEVVLRVIFSDFKNEEEKNQYPSYIFRILSYEQNYEGKLPNICVKALDSMPGLDGKKRKLSRAFKNCSNGLTK